MNSIVAYLSYPYTSKPQEYSEEIKKLALKLQKKYPDLVLILPHFASNWFKDGIKTTDYHALAIHYDLVYIQRADIFILRCSLDYCVSQGMVWEVEFAKLLGKRILEADEMLKKNIKLEEKD